MSVSELLAELQAAFPAGATSGTFPAAAVRSGEYARLLVGLGVPATIALTSSTGGWQLADNDTAVVFAGVAATPLLGVPAAPVHIQFSPDGDDFILLLDVQLPPSWTLAQSFGSLNATVFTGLALDSAKRSALIVTSGSATDPWQTDNGAPLPIAASGLTFAGWFAASSSVVTQLAELLGGGTEAMVTGQIGWDPGTGLATTALTLWTGSTTVLDGETTLSVGIAIYGGIDTNMPSQYRAGIRFDTSLDFATSAKPDQRIDLSALLVTFDQGVIELALEGSALAFPTPATLARHFGHDNGIADALPAKFGEDVSLVQIDSVVFGIGLMTGTLEYAMLTVGIGDGQSWPVWPGVLEFNAARFSFLVVAPLDPPHTSYAFTAAAWFDTLGIPLVARAQLPAEIFTVALDPSQPDPSLGRLLGKVFGHTNGLPDDLLITALDLSADVPQGVYEATVEIEGNWSFDVGVDTEVTFEDLRLEFAYDSAAGPSGEVAARFAIGSNDFDVRFDMGRGNTVLHGEWSDAGAPLTYLDIAIALGIWGLPDTPARIDLGLTAASFDFNFSAETFDFTLTTAKYGAAALFAGKDAAGGWGFVFGMESKDLTLKLDLTKIEIIGKLVPSGDDVIALSSFRLVGATTALPAAPPPDIVTAIIGPEIKSGLVLSTDLTVGTAVNQTLTVRFGGANDGTSTDTPPTQQSALSVPTPAPAPAPAVNADGASPAPQATWINVQRSFGPVRFERVGFLITPQDDLSLLLDAAVSLAGLTIGLTGLEATVPLHEPYVPSFDLAGLQVQFSGGSVVIAGGLEKVPATTPAEYSGDLSVQLANFGLTVFGSYTTLADGKPSLFAFLFLDAPLGGPAFFFVTGLAGGFGYNRSLDLPNIAGVADYPLVAGATGKIKDANTLITDLNHYIHPEENEDWLAAGVRFTSFEMVQSFALLTVAFGAHLEIALLGESTISVPVATEGEPVTPTAVADMVVLVDVSPSNGQLAVCAQLTASSYVLDPGAHLTGGFAFYAWFPPSAQPGDFVVTLGGYNPYFTPPGYYPTQVPRLGLNWQVSTELSVSGGLYFALTPSVLMAGGYLKAAWNSGDISAWFDAQADFLIRFKPFHYDLTISISIGASFTLDLLITTKRITIHAGVSLVLWGPKFGGTAQVHVSVISFTIGFGAAHSGPPADLDWAKYRQSFLPAANKEERERASRRPPPAAATDGADPGGTMPPAPLLTPTDSLVTINAAQGLLGSVKEGDADLWLVSPPALRIVVATQVPSTQASVVTATTITPSGSWRQDLGVGPMGAGPGDLAATLKITIHHDGALDTDTWAAAASIGGVPKGLYLNTASQMQTDGTVPDGLLGVVLTPAPATAGRPVSVPVAELLDADPHVRDFGWSAVIPPHGDSFDQHTALAQLQSTLTDPTVAAVRAGLLTSLRRAGLTVAAAVDVAGFAAAAPTLLAAPPQLRLLGEEVPTTAAAGGDA